MEKLETAATFLEEAGRSLDAKKGVDLQLAAILKAHLLKDGVSNDAVHLARDAIIQLAGERATKE